MNKSELIDQIQARIAVPRRSIAEVLEAQAAVITQHLANSGEALPEATLPGLGKIKTSTRAARTGRNPQTGAAVQIPARKALKFSPGKPLTDALNT